MKRRKIVKEQERRREKGELLLKMPMPLHLKYNTTEEGTTSVGLGTELLLPTHEDGIDLVHN